MYFQCRKCGKKEIPYGDIVIDIKHNGKERHLCEPCFLKEIKQLYGLEKGSTVYIVRNVDKIDEVKVICVCNTGILCNDGLNIYPQWDDSLTSFYSKDIGKRAFLTREDAENQVRKNIERENKL